MKVMIVEDEAFIRLELMHRVTRMGHSVVAATASGEEAVELASRETPDLIIMDVRLKGSIDGIEALRRIEGLHPCRMTILSAFSRAQLQAAGELPEHVPIFSKPIGDQALQSMLAL